MFYFILLINILQGIVGYMFLGNTKLVSETEVLSYTLYIQSHLALPILMGIFASDFIVTEFTSGYIKNIITYGHKRVNILISKALAYYTGIIIISFISPILILLIDIVINGYGEILTLNSIIAVIKSLLIMTIIYIAIGSISFLAAFVSRNTSITIAIIVTLDFMNRILTIFAIRNTFFKKFYKKTIFCQPSIVLADKVNTTEILQAIIVSLITIFVTTLLSNYAFKKIDIK